MLGHTPAIVPGLHSKRDAAATEGPKEGPRISGSHVEVSRMASQRVVQCRTLTEYAETPESPVE